MGNLLRGVTGRSNIVPDNRAHRYVGSFFPLLALAGGFARSGGRRAVQLTAYGVVFVPERRRTAHPLPAEPPAAGGQTPSPSAARATDRAGAVFHAGGTPVADPPLAGRIVAPLGQPRRVRVRQSAERRAAHRDGRPAR